MRMSIGQTLEMIHLDKAGKIRPRKIEVIGIRAGRIRATCLTIVAPRINIYGSYTIVATGAGAAVCSVNRRERLLRIILYVPAPF